MTVEVHLPRLKLNFFVNNALQLESKQLRGMVVDSKQSCGTLTGLKNKLVLRSIKDNSRGVIVPHGTVSCSKNGDHVQVDIKTGHTKDVQFHFYELDTLLWRVTDNGSLKSSLFRALLHAMTSHCLPDQFTGLTGTEQAICILQAASAYSFRTLEQDECELLTQIGGLTPKREYYPSHLQSMQTVTWNHNVPFLSQHESFSSLVTSILEWAHQFDILHESTAPNDVNCGKTDLLQRAVIRNAIFRGAESDPELPTASQGVVCPSSKPPSDSTMENFACRTARLVDEWTSNLNVTENLLQDMNSWNAPIHGVLPMKIDSIGYDEKWLGSASTILPQYWFSLQSLLSRDDVKAEKYRLMIFLSTLSSSATIEERILHTLLSFATFPQVKLPDLPSHPVFNLSRGYEPREGELQVMILKYSKGFKHSPEANLPRTSRQETLKQAARRRQSAYEEARCSHAKELSSDVISCWPSGVLNLPNRPILENYFPMTTIQREIEKRFEEWIRNKELQTFVHAMQAVMNDINPSPSQADSFMFTQPIYRDYHAEPGDVYWKTLFARAAPEVPVLNIMDFKSFIHNSRDVKDCRTVKSLFGRMHRQSSDDYEQLYCQDMDRSIESLEEGRDEKYLLKVKVEIFKSHLKVVLENCEVELLDAFNSISAAFSDGASIAHAVAYNAGQWPRVSPLSLLQHLSNGIRKKGVEMTISWKQALVRYGVAVTVLQKLKRLLACVEESDIVKEISNPGHEGWNPEKETDWLLFEIENNILIRSAQAHIAREMISPTTTKNTIMQMNMGEGKSSVIVPLVAATLADRTKLARVIVLPALSSQMFQILRRKLGGMLNRRVVSTPFSRSVQLSPKQAEQVHELFKTCQREGCVILCQPEHILSFELMGIEKLICGGQDYATGKLLVETQDWLDQHSRDVLDESDEILSVQFELIYTVGLQQTIEFAPSRWTVIMHVLDIIRRFLQDISCKLRAEFPHGFQVIPGGPACFPRINILEASAGDKLLKSVVEEICEVGLPGLPICFFPPEARKELFTYLLKAEAKPGPRLAPAATSGQTKLTLLLLKGLFGHGVLLFVFKEKRWRVNYGLDHTRSTLAVPYRAKDLPALRAEFSHPDPTIVMTCLSYYYGGLSNEQLFTCFRLLISYDNAHKEYDTWVSGLSDLPKAFRSLAGINLRDELQCTNQLFPLMRYAKNVVDFYMSNFVFPKDMREFPKKLSSSGWDIARIKTHPTTGFSGTNDSKYLLPLAVEQAELPQQLHTNATVLDCLLQQHNTFHLIPDAGDTVKFLELVVTSHPPVRVILDVGALVLEWHNIEMACQWLNRVPLEEAQAVVFFNDRDELAVLTRDGRVERLQESPFLKQLDQCLVYLDEAHTRGTDLALPNNYRAAVTLSLRLAKDRLVQGK
jgi:hypothetical protein